MNYDNKLDVLDSGSSHLFQKNNKMNLQILLVICDRVDRQIHPMTPEQITQGRQDTSPDCSNVHLQDGLSGPSRDITTSDIEEQNEQDPSDDTTISSKAKIYIFDPRGFK
jgi:hypothetical protein